MEKEDNSDKKNEEISPSQEQVHNLVFSKEIGWQEIIYDLINTEQLDPWNIDIIVLTNNYLKKLRQFEEENYFISSKVLLAAALLLRIKSEILLNKYIRSIDEILFGKKEKKEIPRFKKVTLSELVESLNKAIITENRRIKKEIINKNLFREAQIPLKKRKYVLTDKIREIYETIFGYFDGAKNEKVLFSRLVGGNTKEEKIIYFSSILYLENQKKIWLEQKEHFGEISIWEKETYFKSNNPFADLVEPEETPQEAIEEAVNGEDLKEEN